MSTYKYPLRPQTIKSTPCKLRSKKTRHTLEDKTNSVKIDITNSRKKYELKLNLPSSISNLDGSLKRFKSKGVILWIGVGIIILKSKNFGFN